MSNDTKKNLETIKNDTKDALDEAKHRTQAAGERFSREIQGDEMPLGDRVKSHVKEAIHNTQAEIDAAKRDVRHPKDDDRA